MNEKSSQQSSTGGQGDGRDAIASAPAVRRSNPGDFNVQRGSSVRTRDDAELGVVSEVRSEHFRVDAPHARDYWLSNSTIGAIRGNAVQLDLDEGQLEDMKLSEPTVRSESPALDAALEAPPPRVER